MFGMGGRGGDRLWRWVSVRERRWRCARDGGSPRRLRGREGGQFVDEGRCAPRSAGSIGSIGVEGVRLGLVPGVLLVRCLAWSPRGSANAGSGEWVEPEIHFWKQGHSRDYAAITGLPISRSPVSLAGGPILDDPSCGRASSGLPCGQLGRQMQCSGRNGVFQPGRFCRLCLRSRDAFPHSLKQSRALASSHQRP